jgi:hypothetical protein
LIRKEIYFSQFRRPGSPRSKVAASGEPILAPSHGRREKEHMCKSKRWNPQLHDLL